MTSERRTKLTDALVRVLRRFLTPIGVALPGAHDGYMRDRILTGRSDLCIAGVFGAGKTRSLAVLLIALSCEPDDFYAVVYTKEMSLQKPLLTRSATFPTNAINLWTTAGSYRGRKGRSVCNEN